MANEEKPEEKKDLTDGRRDGDWASRYARRAWAQIIAELAYLLILTATASFLIIVIGVCLTATPAVVRPMVQFPYGLSLHEQMVKWVLVVLAGMIGGIVFDLKWLYHSVAKGLWSVDRVLWRILVPLNSSIVSVFLAFIISSGLIPFVKNESFNTTYFSLGFGFLFGYFSDNVVAALQNFAQRYIGTTKPADGSD